jgi:hypothetical protein
MANILLGDLYDKWKKVADWVTGADTTYIPSVTLSSKVVELFDEATTAIPSISVPVGSFKTYSFEVWGTGTYSVQLQAIGPSGVPRALKIWDVANNGFLSGNVVAAGFYEVSVPVNTSLRANIASITGGNVSISGGLN